MDDSDLEIIEVRGPKIIVIDSSSSDEGSGDEAPESILRSGRFSSSPTKKKNGHLHEQKIDDSDSNNNNNNDETTKNQRGISLTSSSSCSKENGHAMKNGASAPSNKIAGNHLASNQDSNNNNIINSALSDQAGRSTRPSSSPREGAANSSSPKYSTELQKRSRKIARKSTLMKARKSALKTSGKTITESNKHSFTSNNRLHQSSQDDSTQGSSVDSPRGVSSPLNSATATPNTSSKLDGKPSATSSLPPNGLVASKTIPHIDRTGNGTTLAAMDRSNGTANVKAALPNAAEASSEQSLTSSSSQQFSPPTVARAVNLRKDTNAEYYKVYLPWTDEKLGVKFGTYDSLSKGTFFIGYAKLKNDLSAPAEAACVFKAVKDEVIEVDGVNCEGRSYDQTLKLLLRRKPNQTVKTLTMRHLLPNSAERALTEPQDDSTQDTVDSGRGVSSPLNSATTTPATSKSDGTPRETSSLPSNALVDSKTTPNKDITSNVTLTPMDRSNVTANIKTTSPNAAEARQPSKPRSPSNTINGKSGHNNKCVSGTNSSNPKANKLDLLTLGQTSETAITIDSDEEAGTIQQKYAERLNREYDSSNDEMAMLIENSGEWERYKDEHLPCKRKAEGPIFDQSYVNKGKSPRLSTIKNPLPRQAKIEKPQTGPLGVDCNDDLSFLSDDDQSTEMQSEKITMVDNLSVLSKNPETGEPQKKFSVLGGKLGKHKRREPSVRHSVASSLTIAQILLHFSEDVLYDFEVNARQSEIPGGGMGAFLTYLGARKLKPNCRVKGNKKWKVKLSGEDLFCDFEKKDLVAVCTEGFGLGVHNEAHYEPSLSEEFFFPDSSMHLGQYGPFRKEDRKTELDFNLKSFTFSSEPDEWVFDVAEELCGGMQMIDITDDVTGSPHEIAKRNIPMYVNEVGHNKSYKQTVFINEQNEQNAVKYSVKLDSGMKRGKTIELLTDYSEHYERIRERKGYGLRNILEGQKGDYDRAAMLQQVFDDRDNIVNLLSIDAYIGGKVRLNPEDPLHCSEIVQAIEFIKNDIWAPLSEKLDLFLKTPQTNSPLSAQQWIAMRRIQLIRDAFLQCLNNFERGPMKAVKDLGYPYKKSVNYCRDMLSSMESKSFGRFIRVNEALVDGAGSSIQAALHRETVGEYCYHVKDKVILPFDRALWCPIASKLIEKLCGIVSSISSMNGTNLMDTKKKCLHISFLDAAVDSAQDIRKCARSNDPDELSNLAFGSGILVTSHKSNYLRNLEVSKLPKFFFFENTTFPKGASAALFEKLAYSDQLILGFEPQVANLKILPKTEDLFVMIQYTGFHGNDKLRKLGSAPRSLESMTKAYLKANVNWYLVWQVAFVVHAFAQKFLDSNIYSLDNLCSALNVDVALVKFAVSRGVTTNYGHRERKFSSSKTRKLNNAGRPAAKEIWSGAPTEQIEGGWPPGWTKKVFQRQSGDSKGGTDRYWYTPKHQLKLRSMAEIQRFMKALIQCEGDEVMAYKYRKG